MRSGNGRHRRPRQAPALVVAAGVTGSAMALPLLATGSASAADAATWDRVAECESGGQWSANSGNGLYGGLQFTQDGWERHGGLAYAPSPDLASRAQQIAVAEKALARGSAEWATCAPIAGLTNDGARPDVDPGPGRPPKPAGGPVVESNRTAGLPAPDAVRTPREAAGRDGGASIAPKAPTGSPDPSAPTTGAPVTGAPVTGAPAGPTGSVPPTAPAAPETPMTPGSSDTPVTPGTPSGDGPSVTPGTGKYRGEAAPEETGKAATSPETGRHAASDDELAEKAGVTPVAGVTKGAAGADGRGASGAYTVKPGDSLSGIAKKKELPGGWTALYDANRKAVGTDPDLILPGQNLDLTEGPVAGAE